MITPEFGRTDLTLDFGFARVLVLRGVLFLDANGDGVRDAGEPPLAGVAVELVHKLSGALVGALLSAADGSYAFRSNETAGELAPDAFYEVRVPLGGPALAGEYGALLPTVANAGSDDTRDSDAVHDAVGALAVIADARSGAYGSTSAGNDFGFVGPLVIGDFVWLDENADGRQDSGEPGIEGIAVTLVRRE